MSLDFGATLNDIRASIAWFCDLDGTLVDSTHALYDVYQEFVIGLGGTPSTEEFARLNGPSIPEIVQILTERTGMTHRQSDLVAHYTSLATTAILRHGVEADGARAFLRAGSALDKKIYLVTSSSRDITEQLLSKLNWDRYFEGVICCEDVSNTKPDPAAYELALERSGVPRRDAIVFEDSTNGALAAERAGLRTVMVGSDDIEKRVSMRALANGLANALGSDPDNRF